MNKLPKLYRNENINPRNHNIENCYVKKEENEIGNITLLVDEIFHSYYDKKVRIKTKEKERETYIIAKKNNSVITLQDETIPIRDIIKIEIIKD